MVLNVRNALLGLDLGVRDPDSSRVMGNTRVYRARVKGKTQVRVELHGNLIARFDTDGLMLIWDCGWQTNTTKQRLNALLSCFTNEAGISQRQYQWSLHLPKGCTDWEGFAELRWYWRDNWQCHQAEVLWGWKTLTGHAVEALNMQRYQGVHAAPHPLSVAS